MGRKEKLLARLKAAPKDFTFDEAETLLGLLGFEARNKGKTSGSRIMFAKGKHKILLHKPHPRKEMLEYQLKQLQEHLKQEGML